MAQIIFTCENKRERYAKIRRALILGLPTLTADDQRWLFQQAFGETIEPRMACKSCDGTGWKRHSSGFTSCQACEGRGVFGSELEVQE